MKTYAEEAMRISWPKALAGMVLTCLLSLSVHVMMLQIFKVPYPSGYPSNGWPAFVSLALSVLGVMWFDELILQDDHASRPIRKYLQILILVAMLRESLRLPIMDGFATTAWRYSFVSDAPRVLMACLVCCAVAAMPRLSRWWVKLFAALFVATVLQLIVQPFIHRSFAHVLASIAYLSHDEVYTVPYGWQIELPAYVTFMEPVIACFVMVSLVWGQLTGSLLRRTSRFILLVMLVANALLRPFIYVFYSQLSLGLSLLSMGQFFLETFALALLTTLNWRWCRTMRASRHQLVS